ncbi:hypothetical protein JB92DRAFT_3126759 [Gautieria morchelliformis]|nr:hypothetical protein JB92DRAFT_3126759 [Gautieria morchelliformis]
MEKTEPDVAAKDRVMNTEYARQPVNMSKLKPGSSNAQVKKPNIVWEARNEEWSKKPSMEEDEEVAFHVTTAATGVTGACLGLGQHAGLASFARFGNKELRCYDCSDHPSPPPPHLRISSAPPMHHL